VPAFPGRVFAARVSWVSASLDPNTHRLSVRAALDNKDGALKPGMFASFTLILGEPTAAPAVPKDAIVYDGDVARVWVAPRDGVLMSRAIRTGRISGGLVEILDGLAPGETVATSGTLFIDRAAAGD
jgi:cobalt-zinc-cadmium efflux system membrane fusion protein